MYKMSEVWKKKMKHIDEMCADFIYDKSLENFTSSNKWVIKTDIIWIFFKNFIWIMLCFRYFLLRYEDLVNDPTTTLLNLSKKLEIDIGKIYMPFKNRTNSP